MRQFDEFDALMAGPKYDTYLLIQVKLELAAAQYFSRASRIRWRI